MAVYALASLATLGLAGSSAAHYGSGVPCAPDSLGGPDAARDVAMVSAGCRRAPEQVSRVRLAYGGDNPFVSFLKSLFGVERRSEPRRQRPPERRLFQRASPPVPLPAAPMGGTPGKDGPMPVLDTYRTMCVRLCDGYYWPVSFATSRDSFERDQRTCVQSCGSSTALYYYPNPGGEADNMVSLQGQPYKSLGTAFLYRTTYDANCKCRPHPWETGAIERHKSYAKPTEVRAASRGSRRGP